MYCTPSFQLDWGFSLKLPLRKNIISRTLLHDKDWTDSYISDYKFSTAMNVIILVLLVKATRLSCQSRRTGKGRSELPKAGRKKRVRICKDGRMGRIIRGA